MSDRKYRQRGYQDDRRDSAPRAAPRQPGPRDAGAPRAPNFPGFSSRVRCSRCGHDIAGPIAPDSQCARCSADLHTCVQCGSFDAGSRFECMQPLQARISPKDQRNTCQLFEGRVTVERETGSQRPGDARSAFDDLFK